MIFLQGRVFIDIELVVGEALCNRLSCVLCVFSHKCWAVLKNWHLLCFSLVQGNIRNGIFSIFPISISPRLSKPFYWIKKWQTKIASCNMAGKIALQDRCPIENTEKISQQTQDTTQLSHERKCECVLV